MSSSSCSILVMMLAPIAAPSSFEAGGCVADLQVVASTQVLLEHGLYLGPHSPTIGRTKKVWERCYGKFNGKLIRSSTEQFEGQRR